MKMSPLARSQLNGAFTFTVTNRGFVFVLIIIHVNHCVFVFFFACVCNLFHKTLIKFFKRGYLQPVELQLLAGGTLTHQVFSVSFLTVAGYKLTGFLQLLQMFALENKLYTVQKKNNFFLKYLLLVVSRQTKRVNFGLWRHLPSNVTQTRCARLEGERPGRGGEKC